MPRILVCITGASGAIYGLRLLRALAGPAGENSGIEIHVVASAWGQRVVAEETGSSLESRLAELGGRGRFALHDESDLCAPLASGSFRLDGNVIIPASMGTVGAIASGNVRNLVHRAGAVALKEGWPLILVPRECPLSLIDLRNLSLLSEAGAVIMPASPGFYNRPTSIEELVDGFLARILDALGLPNPLARPWTGSTPP